MCFRLISRVFSVVVLVKFNFVFCLHYVCKVCGIFSGVTVLVALVAMA